MTLVVGKDMATGGFSKSFIDVDAQEMSRGESFVCAGGVGLRKKERRGGRGRWDKEICGGGEWLCKRFKWLNLGFNYFKILASWTILDCSIDDDNFNYFGDYVGDSWTILGYCLFFFFWVNRWVNACVIWIMIGLLMVVLSFKKKKKTFMNHFRAYYFFFYNFCFRCFPRC